MIEQTDKILKTAEKEDTRRSVYDLNFLKTQKFRLLTVTTVGRSAVKSRLCLKGQTSCGCPCHGQLVTSNVT
jgi:hypothetical protein